MKCRIEKLDYEGRGLTHLNGKVVFVENALPDEVVNISIKKCEKHFDIAEVESWAEKRNDRVPSFCPYAKECGGCRFSWVSYEKSLEWKTEIVKDLLKKNGVAISDFQVVGSRPVLEYRNKVSLKVQNGKYGYYKEESHDFIPIQKCLLLNPSIQNLLNDFADFQFQNGLMTIRTNQSGELLLDIETEEELKILESLTQKHQIKGILWNNKCVYGSPYFKEIRENITYQVHAKSFFQVNPYISEQIVQDIKPFFQKEDIIYDLYCGVGFFSLRLSSLVKYVIGIEVSLDSMISAKKNALLNNIENVSFHVGKVERILPKLKKKGNKVIVDPPRSGLNKKVVATLLEEEVDTICYISCNPLTLVRDLKLLQEKYQIEMIRGYDMFCYTKHLECLCILRMK